MMRLTWATIFAALISAPALAQQAGTPSYARGGANAGQSGTNTAQQYVQGARTQTQPAQQGQTARQPLAAAQGQARTAAPAQAAAPFPPLNAAAEAQLNQLLASWEMQSKGTKTLECGFKRWHFDMLAAPAGVHARYAEGAIKYAAPDRGLFRVDSLLYFTHMQEGKPQFAPKVNPKTRLNTHGEYWVCDGEKIIEYDRNKEECNIQDLPPNLRGKEIFNSPLPFVFNLDAAKIKQRYWIRQVKAPEGTDVYMVEAWPKTQEDRAQYKLVQIALNKKTFLPHALILYPPNFNAKTAAEWDHYEFTDVKRNGIIAGVMNSFLKNFIPQKPPANWKVHRNPYMPTNPQMAQQPAAPQNK